MHFYIEIMWWGWVFQQIKKLLNKILNEDLFSQKQSYFSFISFFCGVITTAIKYVYEILLGDKI